MAKKPTAKKPTAKKAVAKKAPVAKKPAAKKIPAKKTVAKKAAPVKKVVAKKTPAKKAPAKNVAAAPVPNDTAVASAPKKAATRGIAISRNKEMRKTLADFTSVQLTAFFKGLDAKVITRIKKSIAKIDDVKREEELKKKKALVAKLQKEIDLLKK